MLVKQNEDTFLLSPLIMVKTFIRNGQKIAGPAPRCPGYSGEIPCDALHAQVEEARRPCAYTQAMILERRRDLHVHEERQQSKHKK